MEREERDATAKTTIVVRKRIRARRATGIATTMTSALVLWFAAAITVLDMDSMAAMIAVQVKGGLKKINPGLA